MLEAPVLSARHVGTMFISSAGAPTATEPSAHCHQAQRVRVLIAAPLPECIPCPLTHPRVIAHLSESIMGWALRPQHLCFIFTHHTHHT